MSEVDSQSQGGRTFSTWASNWTDCTNMTFNKVHRYWSSNSNFHKEILAVLAAVTEVIKENGGNETETEYFAAFMTSMETMDTEESMAAVVYLLSLVIKKVPEEVLRSQFSNVAKKLLEILTKHSNSESTSLLKSLLKTLASLLRVQDAATWNEASTQHIYNSLLTYSIHPKPKVRKQAHQCVCSVLKGSVFMLKVEPPAHHPAASSTAKYCIQTLEAHGAGKTSSSLHVLSLLKDVLSVLPKHSVKSACESILRLMTLSDVVTSSVCMQALHGMFVSRPKPSSLPAELNAQILMALYDYRPGTNDAQPLAAWLAVMEQAHVNLVKLDASLCLSHLPRMFSTCMQCFLAEREDGIQAAANTIKALIDQCIVPSMDLVKSAMPPSSNNTPLHKMYQALESGLSYQYHNSWGRILHCMTAFILAVGKLYYKIVLKSITTMAELRESHRFAYKAEVDYTIGAAIRVMGPRLVLSAVPLLINGDQNDNLEFPRSWMMPILRDNIKETELAFFIDYFLPLSAKMKTRAAAMLAEEKKAGAKTYDILNHQVWSLLSGFCTKPTDLVQSFKNLAKVLGTVISTKSDLQLEGMASLRKLILQNKDNDENRLELAKFSKNYLPILFNLYSSDADRIKDPVRLASLETIKFYVQITDHELIASFYEKAFCKLDDTTVTPFTRHALMDLVNTMVMYISVDRLEVLYNWIKVNLESKDRTTQKKAYRALEEICCASTDTCRQFLKSNMANLQTILLQSLSSAHPSSKAPRLRCLINIFKNMDDGNLTFIQSVIPEAIMCTKETAERARASAFLLLIEMCEAGVRWLNKPKTEIVHEYFKFVVTGLDGASSHHVTTTVLALTRLLFHYRSEASTALLDLLCTRLCALMTSKARDIVQAAIGLTKVLIGSFKEAELAKYLPDIVSGLVSMKDDNRHHFRFKAKEVFERLIRKFGYDTIRRLVPESHHKFINNIKKTQERVKRHKKAEADVDDDEDIDYHDQFKRKAMPESMEDYLKDSDSDFDEETDDKDKRRKKVKGKRSEKSGKAWLKEGNEDDDVMDFLDRSAAQKIMATQPPKQQQQHQESIVKHDFKTAADGRLIINMDDDDDDSKPGKTKKGKSSGAEDLKTEEIIDAIEMKSGKFRKRKRDAVADDDDNEPGIKYKPGGTGIHRPVAASNRLQSASAKTARPRFTGDEYKAKKAGGDMKKKGRPDPYAYVPLQTSSLNKRKQAKFKGQFSGFVKSARKGAAAGRKAKAKKGRK